MNASKRFHPGTLAALHEINERRADLIKELGLARSLSKMRMGSLIDILTLGSFDDCCCGTDNARVQERIVGWPSYRLRDNVKKELRSRLNSHLLYEEAVEGAVERGSHLLNGGITVDEAWSLG